MSYRVKRLIKKLRSWDWCVREKAAKALGRRGDSRAVGPLIVVLQDWYWGVRRKAAEALNKLGWKPKTDTEKATYFVAKQEWGKCVQIGTPAVVPLIAVLEDGNWDVVVEALVKIGTPAVEPLIAALKNQISDVRWWAAEALVKIGKPAVEPLIAVLKDEDSDVRNKAAEALGKVITAIIFGEIQTDEHRAALKNPDVEHLTIPMKSIKEILIETQTYNLLLVERFITYAVNYMGEKHLRKKVEVHIYGDENKLNPHLLNLFYNNFKQVKISKDSLREG